MTEKVEETLDTLLSRYVQFVDGIGESSEDDFWKDFATSAVYLIDYDKENDDWIDALNIWYQRIFGRVCYECLDERTILWIYEAAKARMNGEAPPNECPSAKCMMKLCAGPIEEHSRIRALWIGGLHDKELLNKTI